MNSIVSKLLGAVLAFLSFSSYAFGQSPPAEQDREAWQRFAERAESVIESAAASSSALAVLRADAENWRQIFNDQQAPLQLEIEQLNERLTALGESTESESQALVDLRNRIVTELEAVSDPFRIAAEAIIRANAIVAGIDRIEEQRFQARIYSRGPSPLNPAIWPDALTGAFDYLDALTAEISSSWSGEARRVLLIQRLPLALAFAVLGLVLITRAGHWFIQATKMFLPAAPLTGGGLRSLVSEVVLPLVGVALLVKAIDHSRIGYGLVDNLTAGFISAAAAVLVAKWLAKALFIDDGTAILPSPAGSDWSQSTRKVSLWLGAVVAAQSLFNSAQTKAVNDTPSALLPEFVLLLASAILLNLLGRKILAHMEALAREDSSRPASDRVFSAAVGLMRLITVVAAVIAAIGFGSAAELLIYPAAYTLALLGLHVALYRLLTEIVVDAADRAGYGRQTGWIGLAKILIGVILFVAMIPLLALAWGASVADIQGAWNQAHAGITVGGQQITIQTLLSLVLVFAVGSIATALIQSLLRSSVLPNTNLDQGAQQAVTTGTGYVGLILAAVVAVSVAGFDLTNLAIIAGALSVGIGFGLQTIVSNFVSGIILLVERPIVVGDWIESSGVSGTVRRISVRATHVETFDRARVVIPNSDLISGTVTNWTLLNRVGRIILPIGVAYGTDPKKVEEILFEIGRTHEAVLQDPGPSVVFKNFGADALEFELRVVLKDVDFLLSARSDLNHAIAERFEQEGISIPFPQRDIWIRNAKEDTKVADEGDVGHAK